MKKIGTFRAALLGSLLALALAALPVRGFAAAEERVYDGSMGIETLSADTAEEEQSEEPSTGLIIGIAAVFGCLGGILFCLIVASRYHPSKTLSVSPYAIKQEVEFEVRDDIFLRAKTENERLDAEKPK